MPTVYRVVMTLTAEGYLDHLPNGDYRPGVRALTLGTAALRSLDLVGHRDPDGCSGSASAPGRRSTWRCSPATGCSTWSGCATPTSSRPTSRSARRCPPCTRRSASCCSRTWTRTSCGARSRRQSFAAHHGPNAKVSLDELRDELGHIREQGWAMQDEELAYGLRSVAGPITGPDGRVVAGVNLAVQARDWSTQRIVRELKPVVLATCAGDLRPALGRQRRLMTESARRIGSPSSRPASLDAGPARALRRHRGRPARRRVRSCSGSSTTTGGSRVRSTPSCCSRGSAARCRRRCGRALRDDAGRPGPRDRDPGRRRSLGVGASSGTRTRPSGGSVGLTDDELDGPAGRDVRRLWARPSGWSPAPTGAHWPTGDLDDARTPRLSTTLGQAGLFELLTLVGYYATLALQLRVFRVAGAGLSLGLTRRWHSTLETDFHENRLSHTVREGAAP